MSDRAVVFVMGAPHSGTTLLTLILGSHPDAFALGEMEGLRGAIRQGPNDHGSCCVICEGACPVWNLGFAESFGARRFGPGPGLRRPGALLARINPFARGFYGELFEVTGTDILVDSSKNRTWLEARLRDRRDWRRAAPFLVFISRDGRASVNSWRKKYPQTPVKDLAMRWVRQVEDPEIAFEAFDPDRKIHVRYEDLAADPGAVTSRLCAALGIGFQPDMVAYWTHEHHLFKANAGTVSLIAGHRMATGEAARAKTLSDHRGSFYADLGRTIRPDERWRDEMSRDNLAIFEEVAGETNRAYASEATAA